MYHPRNDTGPLVKALVNTTPGKNLMGYGTEISFNEIAQIWSKNLGEKVTYHRNTVEFMDQIMPGGMGIELGEMMEYISSPGYFGGDAAVKELNLITPKDVSVLHTFQMRNEANNVASSLVIFHLLKYGTISRERSCRLFVANSSEGQVIQDEEEEG